MAAPGRFPRPTEATPRSFDGGAWPSLKEAVSVQQLEVLCLDLRFAGERCDPDAVGVHGDDHLAMGDRVAAVPTENNPTHRHGDDSLAHPGGRPSVR
jgi:hypothetical protein